ncbi:MAG TPA: hypothetical protein GXX19_02610 [Syntrophomonadaceae bacterium]|nr:hypothetical protein [Syntrophomonadaceae bacterium]
MKKKIAMSLIIIGLVSALIGGATFAIFTSTATNADNTFAAGTVKIAAGDVVQTSALTVSNLAPGDVYSGKFTVSNTGSLELRFDTTANASGALFSGANPAVITIDPAFVSDVVLAPGASVDVPFTVSFPIAADNSYQGASGTFNFTVSAEQLKNNP